MLLFIGSIFGSTSIIQTISKNGGLNGALTRSIAGGGVSIAGSGFLIGYTNLESFINAAANGSLGLGGFIFIGGLAALLITWASNILEYNGVAIR
jgi:hypothetical protein